MKFQAVVETKKQWTFPIDAGSTEEAKFKADGFAAKLQPTHSERKVVVYQVAEHEANEESLSPSDIHGIDDCGCGGDCNCGKSC